MSSSPDDALDRAQALFTAGEAAAGEQALRDALPHPRAVAALRDLLLSERRMDEVPAVLQAGPLDDGALAWVNRAVTRQLEGDPASVVVLCQKALAVAPGDAAALHHLGRALHNAGKAEASVKALRAATAAAPDYAEAWHSLGVVLRAHGDFDAARTAFERALQHNPSLVRARLDLGITHQAMDRGDLALAQFQEVLDREPDHVEALVNAGLAHQLLEANSQARACYERALEVAPDHQSALYYYGALLNASMDTEGALAALGRARELKPDDADACFEMAGALEQSNRLQEAATVVREGLAIAPGHPGLRLEASRVERREGRIDAALEHLRAVDPRQLSPRLATDFFYELGTVLDRAGDAPQAMQAFQTANRLAGQSIRQRQADPQRFLQRVQRMQGWVEAGARLPESRDDEATRGEGLCFLIGFPRSGTTLLDTILDAHPDVDSIEERPTLEGAIEAIAELPGGYPGALPVLDSAQRQALREVYFRRLEQFGVRPAPGRLIADKLPLRAINVPLIRALFPAARLVYSYRHPCDVVLSNFMQHYAVNDAFSNFLDLGQTVRTYDAVMRLWSAMSTALDLPLCTLGYEALVADPDAELARVCGFLGLSWSPEMLSPEARLGARGRVRTNSYHQVAEPIYARAVGRWERYRQWLQPWLGLLDPHARRLGYPALTQDSPGSVGEMNTIGPQTS